MAPKKTITINGRMYDAATGLPVKNAPQPQSTPSASKAEPKPAARPVKAPAATRSQTAAGAVHSSVQRSQTLHRRAAKKPQAPHKPIVNRPAAGRHMDIAKSSHVAKFAPHPVTKPAATKVKPTVDRPAQVHPTARRALERSAAKKAAVSAPVRATPATPKEVKEAAIEKALATPKPASKKTTKAKKSPWVRRTIIAGAGLLVIAAALFAVYKFVPSISVSFASAQAGISASYPEFTPDGFSLHQPVTYSDGKVDLKFKSNSNDDYYTIAQTRSSWDSSAVLDNVVEPAAGANYITTKERGLTIYTYNKSAAWVNGGILYEIVSNAPLSGDQIRRIATSL